MSQSEFEDERHETFEQNRCQSQKACKSRGGFRMKNNKKTQKRVFGEMEWSGWIFIMGD